MINITKSYIATICKMADQSSQKTIYITILGQRNCGKKTIIEQITPLFPNVKFEIDNQANYDGLCHIASCEKDLLFTSDWKSRNEMTPTILIINKIDIQNDNVTDYKKFCEGNFIDEHFMASAKYDIGITDGIQALINRIQENKDLAEKKIQQKLIDDEKERVVIAANLVNHKARFNSTLCALVNYFGESESLSEIDDEEEESPKQSPQPAKNDGFDEFCESVVKAFKDSIVGMITLEDMDRQSKIDLIKSVIEDDDVISTKYEHVKDLKVDASKIAICDNILRFKSIFNFLNL